MASAHKLGLAVTAEPTVPKPGSFGSISTPLLAELEASTASLLQPESFFVSWQGVVTLAYRGFTEHLIDLKQRIAAAHPSLPPENPGSKWPKTSLGCLRDGRRLTPEQLHTLCEICRDESAALRQQRAGQQAQQQQQQQQQQQLGVNRQAATAAAVDAAAGAAELAGGDGVAGIMLRVDSAAVVLFECRSLERALSCHPAAFKGGFDAAPPTPGEVARVAGIVAEQDAPDYWFHASKDGHRESHYRGTHLGATLMHPLLPRAWCGLGHGAAGSGGAAALQRTGSESHQVHDLDDRQALLAAIERFRRRVDAALPGMYAWFTDASLHITLRALIN